MTSSELAEFSAKISLAITDALAEQVETRIPTHLETSVALLLSANCVMSAFGIINKDTSFEDTPGILLKHLIRFKEKQRCK